MSQYQPKRFFRNAPNQYLKEYFHGRALLKDFEFDTLEETEIDPIYDAWLALPDPVRIEIEGEFQEIDGMANEKGSKAILDEAIFHEEDMALQFASLTGFHEHAFWTFLNRKKYWNGALAFHHADSIAGSYWRKRKNVPKVSPRLESGDIERFQTKLGEYFHNLQGRGRNC